MRGFFIVAGCSLKCKRNPTPLLICTLCAWSDLQIVYLNSFFHTDLCQSVYLSPLGYNNIQFCLFPSLRFSWSVHQQCAADVVTGARGSSGVSLWAAVACGSVCNRSVIPALHLPLHPLILGSFTCSCSRRQHRWELRLQLLEVYSTFVCLFFIVWWRILVFLCVII